MRATPSLSKPSLPSPGTEQTYISFYRHLDGSPKEGADEACAAPTGGQVTTPTASVSTAGGVSGRKQANTSASKYKNRNFKEFAKKRTDYDEKFVAEMSVSEKDVDDKDATLASFDEPSFERDDSLQFEADLSCELTEFEKEILSKYLKEYKEDADDDATKCEEIEDQQVMLPTTILSMIEGKSPHEQRAAASDGYASSYSSDDLVQEDLGHDETYVSQCQIGTKVNNSSSSFVSSCSTSCSSFSTPITVCSSTSPPIASHHLATIPVTSSITLGTPGVTSSGKHYRHSHSHDLRDVKPKNVSDHTPSGGGGLQRRRRCITEHASDNCDNDNKLKQLCSLQPNINNNTHDINNNHNSNDLSSNNFNNFSVSSVVAATTASSSTTSSNVAAAHNNNNEINDQNSDNNNRDVNLQNPFAQQQQQPHQPVEPQPIPMVPGAPAIPPPPLLNRQLRQNFPIWVGITSCVWGLFVYLMREME